MRQQNAFPLNWSTNNEEVEKIKQNSQQEEARLKKYILIQYKLYDDKQFDLFPVLLYSPETSLYVAMLQ